MADISGFLDDVLKTADLASVFYAALVEKFIPVLPSYVLFPAVGMGAAGTTDLMLRCLVAAAGSIGGAIGWYLLGAMIGPLRIRQVVLRYGRWILLTPRLYERIATSYQRRPFGITFAGQLIPTVRIYQALPAGVLRLPLLPFLLATAIGALCWIVPLAVAGHILRAHGWSAAEAGLALLATLLTTEGVALLIVRSRLRTR
ncbi:DedA family protein [Bradyrhizobium prioriisuperbiae]|uniref:DedA family protein n=1 Tax=Bradyrhizobium prioriisuperbiae TaxID=2854389 RepID=UPI0028E7BA7B|nr:VTT domain-containing protein [Bradyrhizobium prioritasuperba]